MAVSEHCLLRKCTAEHPYRDDQWSCGTWAENISGVRDAAAIAAECPPGGTFHDCQWRMAREDVILTELWYWNVAWFFLSIFPDFSILTVRQKQRIAQKTEIASGF